MDVTMPLARDGTMDERPITAEQVEEIIGRALELERSGPMIGQEDLRAIAAEVSISPAALERATREVLATSHPGPDEPGTLSWLLEGIGVLSAGTLAGAIAGVGFSIPAVTIVLLAGVALASRRDWRTIARLMAQWVLLCGVFGSIAGLFSAGISTDTLWTVFGAGGLLSGAVVWLQDRKGLASPTPDRPLLPGQSEDPA